MALQLTYPVKLEEQQAVDSDSTDSDSTASDTTVSDTSVSNGLVVTEDPKDEIVEVSCQSPSEPFRIHKNLLCEASSHLKDRIEKASEAKERPLKIPVCKTADTFEIFRRWLYDAPVYQRDATQGIADEIQVLMKAHKLGEDFLIRSDFQNEVMDAIIKLLVEHGHAFVVGRVLPPGRKLRESSSQVRKLLVDWIAYGEIDDQKSNAQQLPRESNFQRMLLEAFFNRKVNGSPQPPYVTNPEKYHVG